MNPFLIDTIWLIPIYPLIGAALSIIWFPSVTRLTGPRPSGYVNGITTLLAFLHSIGALLTVWDQPVQAMYIPWLKVAGLDLTIPLEISSITVGACALVTGLNFLAQIYAVGYMEMDWGWARFYSLLGLFEAGMCALVLCNSLFFGYMVLEVLTLGTYLLVGLWFNQSLVVTGARDAFLTKRVGDLFLLMGVVALLPLAGTWNFTELAEWAKTANVDPTVATLVGLSLLAGPMGKCAQFPLHLWLDEAMEGPLPSTILRNSVVVATGAWVLVKLQPVLALSPITNIAMITIGAATAIGATLIAIAQVDIKRALSYIVSAYMGLEFIAVGVGQTQTALVLLLTYAVSMALLVMSIGSVVWNCNTQDLRLYGGLWSRRPLTAIAFIVGAMGLVGLPPLGSSWILMGLADGAAATHIWLVPILIVINGLTALSLTRVYCLIFGGKTQQMTERAPEVQWSIILPMTILMGFTLHVPQLLITWHLFPDIMLLLQPSAIILMVSSLVGIAVGVSIFWKRDRQPVVLPWHGLQDFLAQDLYTAKLYKISIVSSIGLLSKVSDWFDRYLVDGLGNFFGMATIFSGQGLKYSTVGLSQIYLLTIVIGISILLFLVSNFR
jgi:NAD(P)H-quinone oxidoreductase subunit 5